MKFTKTSVAALQLPIDEKTGKLKTDHFFWDDATPGFGIRLHGDRRTWTAQLRINGRTKRMALGDVRRIDLDAARTLRGSFLRNRPWARIR